MNDEIKMKHYENGDSDYMFQVTMQVGSEDSYNSTVSIGSLRFSIVKQYSEELKRNYYIVQEGSYDNMMYGCPEHESKWQAVFWLINKIKGTQR